MGKPAFLEDKQSKCTSETCQTPAASFHSRLLKETWKATVLVLKFMTLAFLINALIAFYVPQDFISGLLARTRNSTS